MDSLLKRIIVAIGSMVVVFPLIVLVINSSPFDEALDPEAARLLSQEPVSVADGDNGYYQLMGIYSAADVDPGAVGRELVGRFSAAKRSAAEMPADNGMEGGIKASALVVQGLDTCDRSVDVNCLQAIEENESRIGQLGEQHQPYLQRYENLLGCSGFQETAMADFRAPLVPNVLPLERLFIAVAYLENRDRPEVFFTALERDLKFRRMVLAESESLLAKMQSARSILFAAKVLSEYAGRHELSRAQAGRLSRILTPLSKEELDISEAFAHEFKMMANAISDYANGTGDGPSGFENALYRRFTQPHATVNVVYRTLIGDLMRISAMSGPDFRSMLARAESREVPAPASGHSWSPYNYGGRRILAIETPDLLISIKIIHDAAAALGRAESQLKLGTTGLSGEELGPGSSEVNGV